MKCSVIGCENRVKFTFPKNKNTRKKWLQAIQRPKFVPRHSHGLCLDHFSPEHIIKESREGGFKLLRARLTKEAIPSIFPWHNSVMDVANKSKNITQVSLVKAEPEFEIEEVTVKEEYVPENIKICVYGDSSFVDVSDADVHSNEEYNIISDPINTDEDEANDSTNECADNNYELKDVINKNIVENIFNEHRYHILTNEELNSQTTVLCRYSIEQFKDEPRGIFYFTGLDSYEKFMNVFHTLGRKVYSLNYYNDQYPQRDISAENKLFLTLWKLRRNTTDYELSRHFCISEMAMKVIFKKMLIFMTNQWSQLDIWPTKEFLNSYLPEGCQIQCTKNKVYNPRRDSILSNLRVNIEKNIKTFKILSKRLNPNYLPLASEITGVCIMLCNFKELIKD